VDEVRADFEVWYAAYPRHVGRGQALRAYCSARRKKVDPAALLEGARKACDRYAGTDQKFIPHPATWLNGERWLDEWKPPEKHVDLAVGANDEPDWWRKMRADMRAGIAPWEQPPGTYSQ
jgi:hypothetical protein